jgi:hypothetical protein
MTAAIMALSAEDAIGKYLRAPTLSAWTATV